jgi:hypothetical protein
VNRDGAPDLVVEQAFTQKPIQIWLNDGHGSFRVAKSGNYPWSTELPTRWRQVFPPQDGLAPYLPSRSGSEQSVVTSESIFAADMSERRSVWPQVLLAICGPRAANLSRGPPSFLPL